PSECAEVERHLRACASCAAEHRATEALLADVALGLPTEPAPPPALRERILASTRTVNRFIDFVQRVADFLDIGADRARALLDKLDDPDAWKPLFPGYWLHACESGPRLAGATLGVLRIQPGARFPYHRHGGDEEVLILQGGFRDEQSGREWHA